MSPMHLETFTDPGGFTALRPDWNSLLTDSAADTLFLTWEWQSVWWQSWGQGDLLLLAARDDDGRLLGLAPLYAAPGEAGRHLAFVGCVEVSDYLDVIVRHGCEAAVYPLFVEALAARTDGWDALSLCNILATSPTLSYLPTLARGRGWQAVDEHEDVCPVIHLPTTWDEYLAALGKHQRHEVRRKLRRCHAEAQVARRVYTGGPDLQQALEVFLRLHRLSHTDKAEFMDDRMAKFFRAMTVVMAEAGYVELNILEIDGAPAAAMYNFRYRDHLLIYNSGYDPQLRPNLSGGIVLLSLCIQDAIQRGLRVFDFLQGDEEYKYRFGATDLELRHLIIVRE